jgi:hypothetical protein
MMSKLRIFILATLFVALFSACTATEPPMVTSISPTKGAQGQTLTVTITGTYFTGATAVSFGPGITVNSFTVDSSTKISGNITIDALAVPGVWDVSVATPADTSTLTSGFTAKQI